MQPIAGRMNRLGGDGVQPLVVVDYAHTPDALEQAQQKLMDDPKTSHPFYWAAFIILGDGAKPLIPTTAIAEVRPTGR